MRGNSASKSWAGNWIILLITLFLPLHQVHAQGAQPVSVINVLVLYTPQASAGAGSQNALLAQINTAFVEANTVFQNSQVNARVHLARAIAVNYVESGSVATDLANLKNPGTSLSIQAQFLRSSTHADLVCLVTETGNDWSFYGLQGPSAENPYSIIRQPYLTGSWYFPVVLSFNFGCQLERPSADSIAAFPYAYGYSFWAPDGFFSTVEAFSGSRIPYFSNPNQFFEGVPMGIPPGSPNAADNVRALNQTAPIVAAFHGPAITTLPPAVAINAPFNSQHFRAGTNISLNVIASDPDGHVTRVDYYAGTNRIASAATPPFKASWIAASVGQYSIYAVSTDNSGASTISDSIQITVIPANDNFADRTRITGIDITLTNDNTLATAEPGEPTHGSAPASNSLWWTYTAPANGVVTLDATAINYPSVDAYTGTNLTTLTNIASSADTGESAVRFPLAAGQTCQIALDSPNSHPGPLQLHLYFAPNPPNDNFANRTVLTGNQFSFTADNRGATTESNEPPSSESASMWWSWTPTINGYIAITATNNSYYYPLLSIYNTGNNLTNLQSQYLQNQYAGIYQLYVTNGVSYTICVSSYSTPLSPGPFAFKLNFIPAPEPTNDHFSGRTTIASSWISLTNSLQSAVFYPNTPLHNNGWQTSLWWSWTAPASGYVTINSPTGPFIDVFTGTALTNLTFVTYGYSPVTPVTFSAVAGTTYTIAASGGYTTLQLNLALSTVQLTAPTNGASFYNGKNLTLKATDTVNDGSRPIQFFANNNLIGTAIRSPYQVTWTNLSDGSYTVIASTTDTLGHTRSSPPININVVDSPPPNDNFVNRTPIYGTELILTNSYVGATLEPGEPGIPGNYWNDSIWWSWTAPTSGLVTLSTSAYDTSFAVYTGNALSNLVEAMDGYQPVSFNASAGVTYAIKAEGLPSQMVLQLVLSNLRIIDPPPGAFFVAGTNINVQATTTTTEEPVRKIDFFNNGTLFGSVTNPPYVVTWTNVSAGVDSLTAVATDTAGFTRTSPAIIINATPANDDFTNAIVLSNTVIQASGTTTGATAESEEPNLMTIPDWAATVWYAWKPQDSNLYGISINSHYESMLNIYTGSALTNLTLITNVDYFDGAVPFMSTAGSTYYFQVQQAGDFTINISPVPANEDLSNATAVVGTSFMINGDNTSASSNPGDPTPQYWYAGTHPVWYAWTAPSRAYVTLNVFGNSNPNVSVFTGTNISTMTMVGSYSLVGSNPLNLIQTKTSFMAAAGTTYYIAVNGVDGGPFTLSLSTTLPPANDNFESRTPLAGMSPTIQGSTYLAGFEPGEPGYNPATTSEGSVWYSWIAPASGTVQVGAGGFSIGIFTGNSVSNLTLVASSVLFSQSISFNAVAGTEYEIAIAGGIPWGQNNNDFSLSLAVLRAQITSPTNGAAFPCPATFEIIANTINVDGYVTSVSFYDGSTLLSTVGQAPFQILYQNIPAGDHVLTVRATDQNGLTTTSQPVEVRVQPGNDNFAQRYVIQGSSTNITADNSGATTEPGELLLPGASGRSLWWTWTAPTNGTVTISNTDFTSTSIFPPRTSTRPNTAAGKTGASTPDLVIGGGGYPFVSYNGSLFSVFTNNVLTNLGLCASNSLTQWGYWYTQPSFSFDVSAGQTYQIDMDGANGSYGVTSFSFNLAPPPANDNFANRIVLKGSNLYTNGTTAAATREPGEPTHGADLNARTVWYSWTAPSSGNVTISAFSYNGYFWYGFFNVDALTVAAYAGNNLTTLIPVDIASGTAAFYALAGTTYQIAIAAPNNLEATFYLTLQGPPPPPAIVSSNTFRLTGGLYQVAISGVIGQSFVVQISSDRQHWTTIRTDTLSANYFQFNDPTARNYGTVYYQVVPLNQVTDPRPFTFVQASLPGFGNFTANLSGSPGQPFRLQGSTNLIDWEDVTTGVITNDSVQFIDNATIHPQRFYRGQKP